MTLSTAELKSSYPLPAYNYQVTVADGDTPIMIGCSEVSGLNVEYQPVTYRHGLSFGMGFNIIPGMRQPIRLTLRKGMSRDGRILQQWVDLANRDPYGKTAKRDILIDLCDESGTSVIHWKVVQAMPIKLEVTAFASDSNDVALATVEFIGHDLITEYTGA